MVLVTPHKLSTLLTLLILFALLTLLSPQSDAQNSNSAIFNIVEKAFHFPTFLLNIFKIDICQFMGVLKAELRAAEVDPRFEFSRDANAVSMFKVTPPIFV